MCVCVRGQVGGVRNNRQNMKTWKQQTMERKLLSGETNTGERERTNAAVKTSESFRVSGQ